MTLSCHQPNYLPWFGLFYKLMASDTFVVLDSVQFPNGRSWVTRNRIKTPNGQLWLTVPVKRKGRGLQTIKNIEVDSTYNWRKKHLFSILSFYKKAPYLADYVSFFNNFYNKDWSSMLELNMTFIKQMAQWLNIKTKIVYSSEMAVTEKKNELIIELCKKLNAVTYLSGYGGRKYMDENKFFANNIKVKYFHCENKSYPQFWGNFLPNLSVIDLLLNCGEKGVVSQINSCCKIKV